MCKKIILFISLITMCCLIISCSNTSNEDSASTIVSESNEKQTSTNAEDKVVEQTDEKTEDYGVMVNLIGMDCSEARNKYKDLFVIQEQFESTYNNDYPASTIVDQEIKSGEQFIIGQTIKVYVSIGPEPVSDYKYKQICLSNDCSAVITEDNSLYMWGNNYKGVLAHDYNIEKLPPTKIMDDVIYCSFGGPNAYDFAALKNDGSLYTWGQNIYGCLGNSTEDDSCVPHKILDNVVKFEIESTFGAAITADGSLYMWGYNDYGQLGIGNYKNQLSPVKVMDNIKDVKLGKYHTLALDSNGVLYTWGFNYRGQLGIYSDFAFDDTCDPTEIMNHVISIEAGSSTSACITDMNELYVWGMNVNYQVGNGSSYDARTPKFILGNTSSVILEEEYSAAITLDGELYMWGSNESNELGVDDNQIHDTPVWVASNMKQISLSRDSLYNTTFAINNSGELYAWGYNNGKYSASGTRNRTPVQIYKDVIEVCQGIEDMAVIEVLY